MKMNIVYRSDGSWDGRFTDPEDDQNTCTIMIIPPLKNAGKQKKAIVQEYQAPRVKELSNIEQKTKGKKEK